jgi:hypothetical protein
MSYNMFEFIIKQYLGSKRVINKGFARGFSRSVLLVFSQFYTEHDLRKNKIVVPFFC